MNTDFLFNSDDMFVLGNIAAMAIVKGIHEPTLHILEFLSAERPKNAGSFLLYALILQDKGEVKEAIRYLEESDVFEAEINRDEALALHLLLLQEDEQFERALDLGHAYLGENIVVSESAHHTIRTVLQQIEEPAQTLRPDINFGGAHP